MDLPTATNPLSFAQSLTPCLSFPVPQCWRSSGFVKCNFFVVLFAGANARKTYLCFPVFAGGPGGLYFIICLNFLVMCTFSADEEEELDTFTPVAIQWHISLHSGLSRDGASGSVMAMVYFKEDDFLNVLDVGSSCSSIVGVSCRSSGFMVFPNSAVLLDGQDIFKVNVGRKSFITVGMISAFFSLVELLSSRPFGAVYLETYSLRTFRMLLPFTSSFRTCWSVGSA
jgi:hypothetical protein